MEKIKTNVATKRATHEIVCVVCGNHFFSQDPRSKYCSYQCSRDAFLKKEREERMKKLLENGVEGEDYVIDLWNGLPTPRIYGRWMKFMHPDRTIEEYKKEFPDAPISSKKDKERVSVNGGKHMKEEKYRKMFSDKFKGENNPRHHSRISKQEIRENSPYCEEFYIKRGLDPSERFKVVEKSNKNRVSAVSLQYFLNKGMSEEEARLAQKERNRTFTLEKCIEKYGEEEGTRRYNERQRKWSEKMEKLYKDGKYTKTPKNLLSHFSSEIEVDFVFKLCEAANLDVDSVFCATSKKGQLFLRGGNIQSIYSYDFCYNHKIIEFNGAFWHANPKIYLSDHYIKEGQCAQYIWDKDLDKKNTAINAGYDVMVVWESEYKNDPDAVISKCVDFLNE